MTGHRSLFEIGPVFAPSAATQKPVQDQEFGFRRTICSKGDLVFTSLTTVRYVDSSSALSRSWLANILSKVYFLSIKETNLSTELLTIKSIVKNKTSKFILPPKKLLFKVYLQWLVKEELKIIAQIIRREREKDRTCSSINRIKIHAAAPWECLSSTSLQCYILGSMICSALLLFEMSHNCDFYILQRPKKKSHFKIYMQYIKV